MPLFNLLLVALIQGLTEFLPISSSGHLILLPALTGLDDQGLAIDVAVHVGTLFAVILFFWPDVRLALAGSLRLIRGKIDTPGARLAFLLVVATLPVVVVGFVLSVTGLADAMRSVAVIGWTMLIFGIVLFWADMRGRHDRRTEDWTLRDAVILGLWQAVALIPGTSRSGITITGARLLDYSRPDAIRVAMLMSIPTIIASGVLLSAEVAADANAALARDAAFAALFAFGAALVALWVMMVLARTVSFAPYVIYRCLLGAFLLWVAYS